MKRVALIACLWAGAHSSPALADPGDAIGSAVSVVNQVTGEFRDDRRHLTTGDDVVQEEVIAAGADSIAELMLRDQTKLAIGPGARMTLDRFIYDANKTSGAIVLNLIKGGFRFITGVAAKPFYAIRTPVAAITVRGTIFDVYIEERGPVWLLLHEGSIRVCNTRGECKSLDDPCRLLRIGPDGALQDPGTWNALPQAREVSFARCLPVRRQAAGRRCGPHLHTRRHRAGPLPRAEGAQGQPTEGSKGGGQRPAGTSGKEKAPQEVCLFQAAPQDVPALPA